MQRCHPDILVAPPFGDRFGRIGQVSLKCDLGINKFSDIEWADELPQWVTE